MIFPGIREPGQVKQRNGTNKPLQEARTYAARQVYSHSIQHTNNPPPLMNTPIILPKHHQRQPMPDKQPRQPQQHLHRRQLHGQPLLPHRAPPHQPQVQQRKVARLHHPSRFLVFHYPQQPHLTQHPQPPLHHRPRLPLGRPHRDTRLEQARARVEPRQAVARAGHEAKQLRGGVDKVENLREQQQDQGLAEVAQDADDDKHHARKVAVRVADEDPRRVPVVVEQGEGDPQKRQEEGQGEEVRVGGRVGVGGEQVEGVVEGEEGRDDDGLRDLDAVDAREDVDAVGGEDGDAGHVDVVQRAEVEEGPQVGLQLERDDDGGHAKVDAVDDQQGDGGEGGDEELVPPADVEEVVGEAEGGDGVQGDNG